jgi:hypothetical protein
MNSKKTASSSKQLIASLLMLICMLLFAPSIHAQGQVGPNNLVKTALSEEEIAGIMSVDPSNILYYNYLTEEAWFIMDVTGEKVGTIESHNFLYRIDRKTKIVSPQSLSIEDLPTFNLLQYDYQISATRNYYRIANSDKLLVIKSQNEIIAGINQFKK